MGNVSIAWKLPGFYLPIDMGNVLLKFGFDIQSQTEVRVQYDLQTAILNVTLLKINRLHSIYTSNALLKFGLVIQSQTEVKPATNDSAYFFSTFHQLNVIRFVTSSISKYQMDNIVRFV